LWVPESRDEEDSGRIDLFGAALATLGLGGMVFGLIESSRLGFSNPVVIATISGGIICSAVFVAVEARVKHPMMPLQLFRSRNFAGANLLTLFLYAALAGTLFFLPLNLIQVQGYSSTAAGAAILPFILIMFGLSRWSGGLVKRYGSRLPLVIGPIVVAIGFALFIRPGTAGNYWTTFLPAVVVLGLGMAISVAPLTTTVMNSVSENRAGIASGINNAVSRTAGLLAIAALGLVMFQAFDACLDKRLDEVAIKPSVRAALKDQRIKLAAAEIPPGVDADTRNQLKQSVNDCFVHGFRWIMICGGVLALASALTSLVFLEPRKRTAN